jgi:glycosyltransferase 2 family protein
MKRYLSVILQYVIFLGLGVFLIWWTTRKLTDEEIGQLKDALLRARYVLVLPAVGMLLLSHYSRALRWRILMEPLGIKPGKANTFFAVMLGYFFNLLVPRLGEVMKCTTLARYEKAPVDKVIGTMVAERGIDFLCLVIVIGLTIVLQADLAGPLVQQEWRKTFSGQSGPGGYLRLFAFLVTVATLIFLVRWLFRRYPEQKLIRGIRNMALGIWQGLTSIRHLKHQKAFILHTVFIWLMYLMSIRLGFLAMIEVQHLGIRPSMTILSTGSLAMIATQGGIGAYQYAVEKSLDIYGIGTVAGLAYGWLLWAVQTLLVLQVGLLCLIILPYYNRNKNEKRIHHSW